MMIMMMVVVVAVMIMMVMVMMVMMRSEESVKRVLTNKCVARETSSCLAVELMGYTDKILKTASIQLTDEVMIVDESDGAAAKMPIKSESLARAGTSLEDKAQQIIMDKLWYFATTRSLRYRLLDNADVVISGKQEQDGSLGVGVSMKAPKPMETGRARNKNMGPFLAAAALKFGLLGALTFKGLYLMVGKALLVSKIALLLATIIGLKKLFSPQPKDVHVEVFTDADQYQDWNDRTSEDLVEYDVGNSDPVICEIEVGGAKVADDDRSLAALDSQSDFNPHDTKCPVAELALKLKIYS
ncbi:uncharacterized protein Osi3 [Battus philenor]|uniref:uncharacterized protein Osi3 n=1 Tax=Battus philenor TaxID=42288 RepID=UPI0035CE92D3